ncbi:MAG: response regulator [Alphaproteobacteria bacterium]|nr:MAG: response regulator [Alphaproteobacteria bacterium]
MIAPVNLDFRMIDNIKLRSLRILVSLDGTNSYNKVRKIVLAWEIIYFTAFILVSLLLYLLIRRYVLSPVENLVAFIKTFESHKTKIEDAIPNIKFRSDELTILGTTLFAQVKKLNEQQQSILERNQKLFEINEKLQEATITKQTFLANMSHEIRTPLSGIIGVGELLAETNLDERQQKYSSILEHSSKSLLGIVNDILDFSLIEAKKITFENRVFKLSDLLRDIFNSFEILATKKDIFLEINLDEIQSVIVSSDSLRITQVLNNLISNALKFTNKGNVKIIVANNTGPRKGNFLFTIQDSGIGMSAEQLEKLFRPFEQTDGSITRKFGGTGLGLVISKSIVELLGGEIWAESRKEIGTTFCFTLNLSLAEIDKPQNNSIPKIENERISSVKVLVVDDNEVNRLIAKTFMSKRFSEVYEQVDGQTAYDFYIKERPRIIFMDLQMPNMDGVSAMKLIREYEVQNSLVPCVLIALTANALAEEKESALQSGFNYYLIKPLNRKILNSLIDEIIKIL